MNIFEELAKFNNVKYFDEPHKYYIDDEQLISGTSFIGLFKKKFDKNAQAIKYAKKHGLKVEDVLEDWDRRGEFSRTKGTLLHAFGENYWMNKCFPDTSKEYDGKFGDLIMSERLAYCKKLFLDFYNDAKRSLCPVALELVVGDKELGIGGMVDCLFWNKKSKQYEIWDYKGLALDTEIPTKNGFTLMKDIKVGDEIFDGNGNLTIVENVSEIHYNPCYKITFDTNEEIICDHEHKWEITNIDCRGKISTTVMTTLDIYNKNSNKTPFRISIDKVDFEEKQLPIDPYVLGIWLGDGSKHCGALTNMNDGVWDEIIKRGFNIGSDISDKNSKSKASTKTIFGLRPLLKANNLLNNKHIPIEYMTSSFEQRIDLLRGLMDSDGSYNKKRRMCVMNTTSKIQAEYVASLIRSLGVKCTIIKAKASGFGKINIDCFHVTFRPLNFSPFLRRNNDFAYFDTVKSKYRYIKKIEKIDMVPTKCISVSSSAHTYMATRGYIKTHNTNREINMTSKFREYMLAPLNFLPECEFNAYSLQLSLYKYVIEKNTNIKIGKMYLIHIHEEQEKYNIIECAEFNNAIELMIEWYKSNKK